MNTLNDIEKKFWVQLYIDLNMDSFARASWNFRPKEQTEQAADENRPTKYMDLNGQNNIMQLIQP